LSKLKVLTTEITTTEADGIIGSALPWDKFTTMAGLNLLKGHNPALFIYSSIILFSLVQK
jgi:hypothetical protein